MESEGSDVFCVIDASKDRTVDQTDEDFLDEGTSFDSRDVCFMSVSVCISVYISHMSMSIMLSCHAISDELISCDWTNSEVTGADQYPVWKFKSLLSDRIDNIIYENPNLQDKYC